MAKNTTGVVQQLHEATRQRERLADSGLPHVHHPARNVSSTPLGLTE